MRILRLEALLILVAVGALARQSVTIRVNASARVAPWKPIWSYAGYDEPNYTYTKNGTKLISELAGMGYAPIYIRTHNLLTTGDGTAALKWGSTNAYTEDPSGNPVYNWEIVDRILDTYIHSKAKPFLEIGFMPEAMSINPAPYQHAWPRTKIKAGWAYPPRDYRKWASLIYELVRHALAKYGAAEVKSWYWEVWNEPDIEYWQGTPEEYFKLYDFAVDAVKRAAPYASVGGPATTGPANPKAAQFLRDFLTHCDRSGSPLDFITFHAKGSPAMVGGRVQMGLAKNLRDVAAGMDIVTSFSKFHDLPIVLSESDPEGCAACSAAQYPQNAYRNGALYPCYTAAAMSNIFKLADLRRANIQGMLTWAFEFEDQPYFAGFRTLATNGVDKPILNLFRMAAMMRGDRVTVDSSAGLPVEAILQSGVRQNPDIDALATRGSREISVLSWNYHDDDTSGPEAAIDLRVAGIPAGMNRAKVRHYAIDENHSNAFTLWKRMGSPQNPTPEQYAQLEASGHLQMRGEPRTIGVKAGAVDLHFSLPRQGVSLVQIAW